VAGNTRTDGTQAPTDGCSNYAQITPGVIAADDARWMSDDDVAITMMMMMMIGMMKMVRRSTKLRRFVEHTHAASAYCK